LHGIAQMMTVSGDVDKSKRLNFSFLKFLSFFLSRSVASVASPYADHFPGKVKCRPSDEAVSFPNTLGLA
jgi:hypothetical protein